MPPSPLAPILDRLRAEPSRTPSVVVTLYGDAIVPRGGEVWLGTLATILGALGIGEGAVRTAVSRLAADGWLARTRAGRHSYYRLAAKGEAVFATATQHIYDPPEPAWTGRLVLAFAEGEVETWRAAGFGEAAPGLWIAPSGTPLPLPALRLDADGDAAPLAARAWRLERLAAGYRRFVATFGPLADAVDDGLALGDLDALLVRVLLVHEYRRVILRDPLLPAALLPEDWPGRAARALCAGLYRRVLAGSEAWLDAHGRNAAGKLPAAGPDLAARFGGRVTVHLDRRTHL